MKNLMIGFLLTLSSVIASAQEFNAKVKINTPKLQTVDPAVFKTLESSVAQLVNETAWSNDEYEPFERISMNITINITEETSPTSFKAEMMIQATRPIFNTGQETQLFSNSDKAVSFSYEQYQPLEFTKNTYNNNLTSILSFYCYYILGFDYDTYAPNGGSKYFELAQEIMTNIPPTIVNGDDGWSSVKGNSRNRYWLIENILSPRFLPMRKALYDYHLRGLDRMSEDIDAGRQSIASAVLKIGQVARAYPNTMVIQLFSISKGDEILQIFVKADKETRRKIYETMVKIDPPNASKYDVLNEL